MSGGEITPEQFAAATFRRVAEWAHAEGHRERSPFKAMLTDHFGSDPATFPVTAESIAAYDLPNLQLALDAYLETQAVEHRLVGFGGDLGYAEMSLSGLVHGFGFGLASGPVRRTVVPLEHGLDVLAVEQEDGERFIAEIRSLMRAHNVYRGKVLALRGGSEMGHGGISVEFPAVDPVAREQIVLPDGVLDVALDLLERGGRITRTMLGGDGGRALSGLADDDEDGWQG